MRVNEINEKKNEEEEFNKRKIEWKLNLLILIEDAISDPSDEKERVIKTLALNKGIIEDENTSLTKLVQELSKQELHSQIPIPFEELFSDPIIPAQICESGKNSDDLLEVFRT